MNCQRLSLVKFERLKNPGERVIRGPSTFINYTSRSLTKVLPVNSRRNNSLMLPARGGVKEQLGNMAEHFVLLKTIFPEEKLFSQNLTCSGFIRAFQQGRGKCSTPASSTLPHRGREMPNSSLLKSSCPTKSGMGIEKYI